VYNLLYYLFYAFFKLFFRLEIIGANNLPRKGGVIIAANHVSLWDPPVLGTAIAGVRQPIHFMAKQELFSPKFFGYILKKLYTFPVRRGMADRNAIRTAIGLLEAGKVVALFPEGTRSKTGKLGPAQPGVAMIALKAGVPIVPAAIVGTNRIGKPPFWLPKLRVIFGQPITIPAGEADKNTIETVSQQTMAAIAALLNTGQKI